MPHVLITFLGRAAHDRRHGYREGVYALPSGARVKTAQIGAALAADLQVDELVVVGTAGSMWDVLQDSLGGSHAVDAEVEALMDAAERQCVTRDHLQPFGAALSERLGRRVRLELIDYARDLHQQTVLLQRLTDWVRPRDVLSIDVTHGLRHLPMVMLVAAQHLKRLQQVQVKALYYGAHDMAEDGVTPIINLDGLLHMLDAFGELAAFDASGRLGHLAAIWPAAGDALRRAEHYADVTMAADTRQALMPILKQLEQPAQSPLLELLMPEIRKRVAWARQPELWQQERALAQAALDRGDFVRAAIFAQESVLSRGCGNAADYYTREATRERLRDQRGDESKLFRLRNALAHGLCPDERELAAQIKSPAQLRDRLRALFKSLLA